MINQQPVFRGLILAAAILIFTSAKTQQLTSNGQPARLEIWKAGEHSIRITLKPASYKKDFPSTPAVVEKNYAPAVVSLTSLSSIQKTKIGSLTIQVKPSPLTVSVFNSKGKTIQEIVFQEDGKISFNTNNQPVLGLGEGGSKPEKGINWRELPVEFDRHGIMDAMEPRWQSDAYGSRNPVAMLAGTGGWGIFVAAPWVQVDLQNKQKGYFIPRQLNANDTIPQNEKNQNLVQGKGLPPTKEIIPGLYDFFVFDASEPAWMMKDFAQITGPAALPPKWALGYMQSHRTLKDDAQMTGIVDSFRTKKIPLDAVIYLGTGFTPRGWNTMQPSFDFNLEVFKNNPADVIAHMHQQHTKVVLHMVPWDRDRLPTLQGTIPPKPGEILVSSHLLNYWKQHEALVKTGVDAFWPDEGDWFNLHERIKRHQLYYQGSLYSSPQKRPWSLQRNGYPGIAQWGGWVWSGDTESSWKTLEAQIAVGLNYSLSIAPFWGSDIGGFYPNAEKTGELYARWFQFGAFCGSFRSHGRTWMTNLPWGWGLNDMGPKETNNANLDTATNDKRNVLQSEMNNPLIEPIVKKYVVLRYQLLPYTYTTAWEARQTGMPLMRAMWLHYPQDTNCTALGNQYLWGRDLLIAPVFTKGATERTVYLPKGIWYDWWTNEQQIGGKNITRGVELATMPIYVKAGAIIPFDTIRQYADQPVTAPTTLKVYTGANGNFALYDDDGTSQNYLKGEASIIHISWNDATRTLVLHTNANQKTAGRLFTVQILPENTQRKIEYNGQKMELRF
jgi:alpha-glucosidase (family GH31 glycosyl hydrolase)